MNIDQKVLTYEDDTLETQTIGKKLIAKPMQPFAYHQSITTHCSATVIVALSDPEKDQASQYLCTGLLSSWFSTTALGSCGTAIVAA